jgi:hypothetical protein
MIGRCYSRTSVRGREEIAQTWKRALTGLGLLVLVSLFLLQALFSSRMKAPVNDSWIHYLYGERALGTDAALGIPVWDGTMPVSALNVLGSRAREGLAPWLGAPVPVTVSGVEIPSLLWARLPNVLMSVSILVGLWFYARRFIDGQVAWLVLLLGTLEPNLLGHSRFISTDIPSALGYTFGSLAIAVFLIRPGWFTLAGSALVVALAQVAKVSNLLLYPFALAALLVFLVLRSSDRSEGIKWVARWCAVSVVLVLLVLQGAYSGFPADQSVLIRRVPETADALSRFGSIPARLEPLVPLSYSASLATGRAHNASGHPAYLLGRHRDKGWFYYFPLAILLKTQLPLLLLVTIGVFGCLRRKPIGLCIPALAAAFYLAVFCLGVRVNIGVRHVLPVYPALLLLAGWGLRELWVAAAMKKRPLALALRVAVFLLPAWMALETWRIYPHYESYFNEAAGGPCSGWKVLGDSNVQWGQDIWIMEEWIRRQNRPVSVNPAGPTRGLILVRADFLAGHTPEMAAQYQWLRSGYEPTGCVTPGLIIFDVP